MKKSALIIALAAIVITGCRKNPPYPPPPPVCCGTSSGAVLVQIKDTIPASRVFAKFIDSLNLTIQSMNGFNFNSPWPADSLNAVWNYVSLRSYIDPTSQVSLTGNSSAPILVQPIFTNMKVWQERDWLSLANQLQLKDINDSTKSLFVTVTPGQEESWAKTFETFPMVKHASVIYTMY